MKGTLNPGLSEKQENPVYILLLQTALHFILVPGFNTTELHLESKHRKPVNNKTSLVQLKSEENRKTGSQRK